METVQQSLPGSVQIRAAGVHAKRLSFRHATFRAGEVACSERCGAKRLLEFAPGWIPKQIYADIFRLSGTSISKLRTLRPPASWAHDFVAVARHRAGRGT